MVGALDFRSGGRWFKPGPRRRVVSLDKKLYPDGLASHPGGSSNYPGRFMLQKPELSAALLPLLASPFTSILNES